MIHAPNRLPSMLRPLWGRVAQSARAPGVTTSTVGARIQGGAQGTDFNYSDPGRIIPVYVVGTAGSDVLVRTANPTPLAETGYTIDHGNTSLIRVSPYPGFTVAHFRFDVIGPDDENESTPPGYQPQPKDSIAQMAGGFVLPIRRMLLVDPADVDDLCEPCEAGASASMPTLPPGTPDEVQEILRQQFGEQRCEGCNG